MTDDLIELNRPPLVPRTHPFSDFVIAQGPLRSRLTEMDGLRKIELGAADLHLRGRIQAIEDGLFMGVAPIAGELLVGTMPYSRKTPLGGKIRNGLTGQYVNMARKAGGSLTIGGDCFGMVPLFLWRGEAGALLSSQLHLIAIALNAAGLPVRVDLSSMIGAWFVDNSLAIQQSTRAALIEGAEMIRADEEVVISKDGLHLHASEPQTHEPVTRDEYKDLIKVGAQEIRDNLSAVVNSGRHTVATLTGGRDSRMIFAGLVSLGLEREVAFSTRDIDDGDMQIATGLVSRYGGAFEAQRVPYSTLPVDPRRSFDRHRSTFFGAYHDYKGVGGAAVDDKHTIALIGGCGEVYRGFLSRRYDADLVARPFSRENFEALVAGHASWKKFFPEEAGDLWREALFETMAGLPGETLADRLEEHYFHFRNRLHFGASSTAAHPGRLPVNPLMSPTLKTLAARVPASVRASGAIVFDVTRELDETVAYLPYAKSGPEAFSAHGFHTPSRYDGAPPSLEPDLDLWQAAARKRSGLRLNKPPYRSREAYNAAMTAALFERLADDARVGPFVTPKLQRRFSWLQRDKKKFRTVWLSRLASAHDVLSYN
ncbi:hypothetical protein [Jannaschia seohaensis]|uniref:Asparagine synthase (Glutamine-hydrolysing) n=1 Tax=Jannaschia seohaensis TaxID=475081 RepID=A0A2Y9A4V1_9RHOB|nr:hypothetical protein [Jannaschia seohaensis]PWJ22210.1 hypothetical protein BCF38_101620 [Jannaschia seohaensis]SSA38488.1 hypothetical protein SAMN05421539_101620 [Jannaschia seohaensis]